MRRKIAYIAVIIILPVLMIAASCGGDDSVNFVFNQVPSDCAAVKQSTENMSCDGSVFTFNGSVVTPNPCNYLKAEMDFINKSNIMIKINAVSTLDQNGYCIECLGEISFNGTVDLAGVCSKTLSIVYNGTTIAEYEQGH